MGTHPIFESDFDCLTDVEMGLYDDDDDNVVAKVGGGWSAAANQAVSFRAEQQRKRQEESQARYNDSLEHVNTRVEPGFRDRQKQKEQQAKQQLKANAFTAFMPNRISKTPTRATSSNINKAKVPVPSYRNIQAAAARAAAETAETGEKRDVIDRFPDEYDPLKPNDYAKFVKRRREGKHKLSKYAHFKKMSTAEKSDSQGNNDSSSSDEENDNRRKAAGMGKAMIAAPTNLYGESNISPQHAKKPSVSQLGAKLGMRGPLGLNKPASMKKSLFGNRKVADESSVTPPGGGLSVAEKIMQKYGHKEGAGLGKMNQGIAAPLEVEKTSRRGGKIVATKPATSSYGSGSPVTPSTPQPPPPNIRKLPNLSRPTKIVCLQNMVSANEVDSDLPDEVSSECSKFGQVVKVRICEIPNVPTEEQVRIFLEFSRMEEAMKAVIGLHNRFFNKRNLIAAFYNIDMYEKGELTGQTNG